MDAITAALFSVLVAIVGWIGRRLEKRLDQQDNQVAQIAKDHSVRLKRIERRLRDVRRKVGLYRESDDHEDDTVEIKLQNI